MRPSDGAMTDLRSATSSVLRLTIAVACLTLGGGTIRVARADDATTVNRQKIEQMTPEQKEELRRRYKWFHSLGPEEQQRIRHLHGQLGAAADAEQLRQVMQRYHHWLMELPPYRREELTEMDPAERIQRIKQLCAEEAQRKTRSQDAEGSLRWMAEFAARHPTQYPPEMDPARRERLEKLPEAIRRRMGAFRIMQQWSDLRSGKLRPGEGPPFTDADLNELRSYLSEATQRELAQTPVDEQWARIDELVRHAGRYAFFSGVAKGAEAQELEQALDAFFSQLPDEEQNRLLDMPSDEMRRELWNMYMMGSRTPGPPPFRGGRSRSGQDDGPTSDRDRPRRFPGELPPQFSGRGRGGPERGPGSERGPENGPDHGPGPEPGPPQPNPGP